MGKLSSSILPTPLSVMILRSTGSPTLSTSTENAVDSPLLDASPVASESPRDTAETESREVLTELPGSTETQCVSRESVLRFCKCFVVHYFTVFSVWLHYLGVPT